MSNSSSGGHLSSGGGRSYGGGLVIYDEHGNVVPNSPYVDWKQRALEAEAKVARLEVENADLWIQLNRERERG